MTRAASNTFNPQVVGGRANGNTIIPSFDGRVDDLHICRLLNMNTICIRAVTGSYYFNAFNKHILATVYYDMVQLAV